MTDTIIIKEIKGEDYYDVTINGDTWSVRTKKDALEMAESVLIKP